MEEAHPQDSRTPREKLRLQLQDKENQRARGNGPRRERRKRPEPRAASDTRMTDSLRAFPMWILKQLLRTHDELVHGFTPLMLLFRVNLTSDSLFADPTMHISSKLDVLIMKINGGVYYELDTTGGKFFSNVLNSQVPIAACPERLLYVYSPPSHIRGAVADITFDLAPLAHVVPDGHDFIPAEWARADAEWDVPLLPVHLPTIAAKRAEDTAASVEESE